MEAANDEENVQVHTVYGKDHEHMSLSNIATCVMKSLQACKETINLVYKLRSCPRLSYWKSTEFREDSGGVGDS